MFLLAEMELIPTADNDFFINESRDMIAIVQSMMKSGEFRKDSLLNLLREYLNYWFFFRHEIGKWILNLEKFTFHRIFCVKNSIFYLFKWAKAWLSLHNIVYFSSTKVIELFAFLLLAAAQLSFFPRIQTHTTLLILHIFEDFKHEMTTAKIRTIKTCFCVLTQLIRTFASLFLIIVSQFSPRHRS